MNRNRNSDFSRVQQKWIDHIVEFFLSGIGAGREEAASEA
jgi:hypothetical protein